MVSQLMQDAVKVYPDMEPIKALERYLTFGRVACQRPKSVPEISGLTIPINSTVILEDINENGDPGVIVNHDGQKFLITTSLIVGEYTDGEYRPYHNLRVFKRGGGYNVPELRLDDMILLYSGITPPKNVPRVDIIDSIAIFDYRGNIDGVEIAEPLKEGEFYPAVAIGYPRHLQWIRDLQPLLSFGRAYRPTQELFQYVLSPSYESPSYDRDKIIMFRGKIYGGNYGGGLFTLDGLLIGVATRVVKTMSGIQGVFVPVKETLEFFKQA